MEQSTEYFSYQVQLDSQQYLFVFNRLDGTNRYAEMQVYREGALIEQDGICKSKGF